MKNEIPKNFNLSTLVQYFFQFKAIHIKKGEIIFRPDFPNHNVFYIENGFVKIYSIVENGEEKIIMFYKAGDFFPLTKLFKNSAKNFFAETLVPTTIRYVDENEFQKFLNGDSDATTELINYFSDYMEYYLQRVENLGFMKSSQKVIFNLLSLIKRFGLADKNGTKIELPITQREIGSMLAMTRETVSREFEKLQKENIIDLKNHEIIIKDIRYLIEKADNFCEYNWQL